MITTRQLTIPAVTSARNLLADRGGLVVSVGFYLIVTSVLGGLWRAAAAGGGGQVAGYTPAALTWYIAMSEAAVCALNIRMIEVIGDEIASGAVAVELLRPIPVVAVRLALEGGRCLTRVAVLLVAGFGVAWLAAGPPPSGLGLLLAAPSIGLAILCNLALQHAVAAAAFWIRDARSTWFLYQKLVFILGGMLLPLEVLPGWLHSTARVLPFMTMAYVPARFTAGHVEPSLLLVQLAWLAVLVFGAAAAFRAGARHLQVVGG